MMKKKVARTMQPSIRITFMSIETSAAMLRSPGGHRPSRPTGGYVRGFGSILSDGIRWNKFIIHLIHLQMWADLEIPDKKGFPVEDLIGRAPRRKFS